MERINGFMNNKTKNNKIKIDELSKQYALTDEQLKNYIYMNNIDLFGEFVNLKDKKTRELLEKLEVNIKKNHKNKSGLESIYIEGLFGKYNYKFNFECDISIWVSENGIGKTTILNIIVAILTCDASILYDIQFDKIEVVISGRKYIIDKDNRNENTEYLDRKIMFLLDELDEYLPRNYIRKIQNDIILNNRVSSDMLDEVLNKLPSEDCISNNRLERAIHKIKTIRYSAINDVLYKIRDVVLNEEVVFYPTYRRVEVGIERIFSTKLNKPFDSDLKTKYMGFGMGDVKNRIKNLLDKMRIDANTAYIKMNGNIISELLDAPIDEYLKDYGKIDLHKVDVVIKRIGEERINNIDKLRSFIQNTYIDENNQNIEFLFYYLQKLADIYNSQEAMDRKISSFSSVCTKYLSGKKIEYDETMLTVDVLDSDGFKIDFDDLSSGEKQIVSIFSKVYLDVTSSCIFIIDEPEISLSIKWQKEFLKDIYDSGRVALLIATTHSPFIFKNEYMDYVKELEIHRR